MACVFVKWRVLGLEGAGLSQAVVGDETQMVDWC